MVNYYLTLMTKQKTRKLFYDSVVHKSTRNKKSLNICRLSKKSTL